MANKDLEKICELALKSHGLKSMPEVSTPMPYWDELFFQVNQTTLFLSLSSIQQQSFLTQMSTHILQEACSIEKAGLSYSARMNLMSSQTEEKILYALIGAEEALHLKALEPFLHSSHRDKTPNFAKLISQWIEKLERPSLLVMIQILLEGWGISYYGSLAQNTSDQNLKSVFNQILQDETRHHASGVVLYRQEILSAKERVELESDLATLFQCVQIGPQQVAQEMALASGEKRIDFEKLFTEMKALDDTKLKLEKLKKLLEKSFDIGLVSACLNKELFKPYNLDQMAAMAESQYSEILRNSQQAQVLPKEPFL